jgi:hypothetical protein
MQPHFSLAGDDKSLGAWAKWWSGNQAIEVVLCSPGSDLRV